MIPVVTGARGHPSGHRGRLGVALAVAGALAFACPVASAQLPGPAGDAIQEVGDAVEQTAAEPLPAPVEDVVSESPVAPVREEVRRVVGEVTAGVDDVTDPDGGGGPGTGGGGGGAGGSGAGGGSADSAPRAAATPSSSGGEAPGASTPDRAKPRSRLPGADRRERSSTRRAARRAAERAATRDAASAGGSATPAAGNRGAGRGGKAPETEDRGNALTRTVERLVEVVRAWVWVALGVLALVALVLGARAYVERRRVRVLAADRELLLRDVGLLERALLPEVPPTLGGVAASVAYRPCDGPAAGGDFYDVFELPGGRVAALVGDVSGHGPEALELTNVTRSGLRACLEAGMAPREALDSVSRRTPDTSGRFISVVAAVYDPEPGRLAYATAGHPQPIFVGADHEPVTEAASPPVGLGFRTGLRETLVSVPAASTVCLFTDGLIEARVRGELLGRERLAAMVAELGPGDGAEILLERVRAAADGTPDDLAVCLLRPVADGAPLGARVEILEVEPDEVDRDLAARFVAACGVAADDAVAVLEEVHAVLAGGGAVIEVTVDENGARAVVGRAAAPLLESTPA